MHTDSDWHDYENWRDELCGEIDQGRYQWKRIGLWVYPAHGNTTWSEKVAHYCFEYWLGVKDSRHDRLNFDKCSACNEPVPEGLKMVVLLEKL